MRTFGFVFATIAALAGPAAEAGACASAPPEGAAVRIADEEALIAWNAETKTEHFVRRASFRSSSDAFGFIVPTPSVPTLAEVDDHVFDDLARELRPPVELRTSGWELEPGCSFLMTRGATSAVDGGAPAVRVLGAQSVAGYDAVILAADDTHQLADWLAQKGFAQSPALVEWLAPYVEKRWVLTAFRIQARERGQAGPKVLGTSTVRMTFHTEQPFYPYREPRDQRETLAAAHEALAVEKRVLRVYFAADRRYGGALGDGSAFPAKTELARMMDAPELLAGLVPKRLYLTVFEDASTPRQGTDDVLFSPSAEASDVAVAPIVVTRPRRIFIPVDLGLLLVAFGAGGGLALRRWRRRRA